MEVNKGFQKTEIGVFPNNWSLSRIEDLAKYRRGSFPQPYGLSKWYDSVRGQPFVQVFDVAGYLREALPTLSLPGT